MRCWPVPEWLEDGAVVGWRVMVNGGSNYTKDGAYNAIVNAIAQHSLTAILSNAIRPSDKQECDNYAGWVGTCMSAFPTDTISITARLLGQVAEDLWSCLRL
jgi:hypothetical protein